MPPVSRTTRRPTRSAHTAGTSAVQASRANTAATGAPAASKAPSPVAANARAAVDRIDAALTSAAKISRGGDDREPMVTPREAARVDEMLRAAPSSTLEWIAATTRALPVGVARAVFLRAVAARATHLAKSGAAGEHNGAVDVLAKFALTIGVMTPAEIRARASVLDRDPKNTSALDAQKLWQRRGNTKAIVRDDKDGTNDGLSQRFTASCGPTTLQMLLAEADPVFAFSVTGADAAGIDENDVVGRFQRALLESEGGVALSRVAAFDRSRLRNVAGRLVHEHVIGVSEHKALLDYALKQGPLSEHAARALAAVRDKTGGFPSHDDVVELRREVWPEHDVGLGDDELLALLARYVTPKTGVEYCVISCARGRSRPHLDDVERALKSGADVPLGTDEPGHWMLISNVRGRKPMRSFFIHDPDAGRSAWIKERDLVSGAFGVVPFNLNEGNERPYADTFVVPRA